jgi:protein TonB
MGASNGASGPYRGHVATAVDPLSGVLTMGPRIPVAAIIALAVVLHAGAAAGGTAAALFAEIVSWNRALRDAVSARLAQTYDIDVAKPQELPPEPPKVEEKEPPPPAKEVPKEAPPPAQAQAAKIIAQEPDKDEVVDMRDSFVQGTGATYAGGITSSNGTSKDAVRNVAAAPTGVPGGTGTSGAQPAVRLDKSRGASLSGSSDWGDCPFPAEADAEQVDQAYVTLQVKVRADGSPESATVVQDPGQGFGREARKCAMRKRYQTAQDVDGNAIAGQTKPFRVHFTR